MSDLKEIGKFKTKYLEVSSDMLKLLESWVISTKARGPLLRIAPSPFFKKLTVT